MKKFILFYFVVVILVIATSCSKDKQILINTTWKVESMKIHADSALTYPPIWEGWWGDNKPIILSFPKQNTYIFQLEANGCGGNVSIIGNKISFKSEGMTSICCDSPFAESCVHLLINKINHYTLNNTKLILTGTHGEIINLVEQ